MKKTPRTDDRWSPLLPADDPGRHRDCTVRVKVWRWKGAGGWHLATLPPKAAAKIRRHFGGTARGWGSIRARFTTGKTAWDSSLFPHKPEQSYLFAIKASVRKAEDIAAGDTITVSISIL